MDGGTVVEKGVVGRDGLDRDEEERDFPAKNQGEDKPGIFTNHGGACFVEIMISRGYAGSKYRGSLPPYELAVGERSKMRCLENVRPHPNPLPQEREKN